MVGEIHEIHIGFENVEVITVPYEDVRFIAFNEIFERVHSQYYVGQGAYFSASKYAKSGFLKITNRPEYQRIFEHDDITDLDFISNGESIFHFYIDWADGSGDEVNRGQQTTSTPEKIEIRFHHQTDLTREEK